MIGSRVPKVTWMRVASPLHSITEEMSTAICCWLMPMLGPSSSGTATVAPNMVSVCCNPSTTARPNGGRSLRP